MLSDIRQNWTREEAHTLFALPFADLLYRAQTLHRKYFDPNKVQLSTLMSIKTGLCPEDCGYCSQSARFHTGLKIEKLVSTEKILAAAKQAKANGASRFCMGAAWRNLPAKALEQIKTVIIEVNKLGMETCVTTGMLTAEQAQALSEAGLNYYNHNLDTSAEYYPQVVSTHTYQQRLDTLAHVRNAGIMTCSGGIVGMGETADDRIGLLISLANLPQQPESVPINQLVPVPGTPLGDSLPLEPFDFIRIIAVARLMLPRSYIRLAAGRRSLSDETQALCFQAGANSIFYGDHLLTTANPDNEADMKLFNQLGITPLDYEATYASKAKNLEN